MSDRKQKDLERAGCGPVFEVTDLPEPPRDLNAKKLFAIMGPAVIALGGTIGGGEWLVGPSLFVKWGLGLLWITTVSALLQVFLNPDHLRDQRQHRQLHDGPLGGRDYPPEPEGSPEGVSAGPVARVCSDPECPFLWIFLLDISHRQGVRDKILNSFRSPAAVSGGCRRPLSIRPGAQLQAPHCKWG